MFHRSLLVIITGLAATLGTLAKDQSEPKRLEVLFLGDDRGHQPIERYRVLKQALGPKGFNLTFIEDLKQITRAKLDLYDALLVYANHESDEVPEAISPWIRDGGGLVALHSACGNFHPSKAWFDIVGGRFKSHEGHDFSPKTVDPNHPITRDLPVLKSWDETYQHKDLTADRHLLQVREPMNRGETEPEPWTWTRNEGRGRVFYTASGHDMRCWSEPAYQELVRRAILWAVGEKRAGEFSRLKLPELVIAVPEVANRAHPEIPMMPLQKPLSAKDSALHTQVPAGTKLVLFACEPMVKNPIAIDWDERGRAWVVESFGYPNSVPEAPGSGEDKIKILEDGDGDGRADKMTVFAEGLRHCTATVFVKGGLLATDGRDLIFLGDEDGDGKSDSRKVMATGLNINDTHASTSQLQLGIDNWIYATVGYSGVKIELGGKTHKFGSSVFRFRPDLSVLEYLQKTTNNTWGLGFTEEGDVIGSTANNNPSWILSIPSAAYAGSGIEQPATPRLDTSTLMYPNTRDVTQVDQLHRFTAAAGHFFYTDNILRGTLDTHQALICEPTGHLVAVGTLHDKGALKETHLRGNNLFASADAWSAPVAARVGPDGAVWVADWYNPIVQHNVVFRFWNQARDYDQPHSPYHVGEKGPGRGNAYETPLRDRDHGRIWRIVPEKAAVRSETGLDPLKPASLILGLSSPSQHIRLHAQRLLIERGGVDAIEPLEMLISENTATSGSSKPLTAIHAIWALEGLKASATEKVRRILTDALRSPEPLVRRHAMMALGPNDPAVISALPDLIRESQNPRELLHVFTVVAQTSPHPPIAGALWKRVSTDSQIDGVLREAAQLAMRRQGAALIQSTAGVEGDSKKWFEQEILVIRSRAAVPPNSPQPAAEVLPAHLIAGRDAYMKACVECHQPDGAGVPATFPPLVGSEWVTGNEQTFLRIVLGGLVGPVVVKGVEFNSVMPGHSHSSDEDLAAIASYVRHAFGGKSGKPFSPSDIKALRPEVDSRKFAPWTVDELRKLEKK